MTAWAGRRVLITGYTGLLGSALALRLHALGAEVCGWAIQDRPWSRIDLDGPETSDGTLRREWLDLATGPIEAALERFPPEIVFHLAARPLVGDADVDPAGVFAVNVHGTIRLLEAIRRRRDAGDSAPARIVVASSDKAYGPSEVLPLIEDLPLEPVGPYEVSKACADLAARSFAHRYGLPIAITRSSNLYGPGDSHESRLVPGAILAMANRRALQLRCDGSFRRDYLFVEDAVEAHLRLGDPAQPWAPGRALNLGTGQPTTVADLLGYLREHFPAAPEPRVLGTADAEIRDQWVDAGLAERELEWKASTSLEAGLQRTVEWYHQHPSVLA